MLIQMIEPDFIFENDCGKLTQLVRNGWKQVNVVQSLAGCTRGGHYHKLNEEAFYVVDGSFLLEVCDKQQKEMYEFQKGDMFVIHKNVAHTFCYKEDTILVAMYDQGVELDNGGKDIWPWQGKSSI